MTFEQKALRLFVSDFNFYEALADKGIEGSGQVLLQLESVKVDTDFSPKTFKLDNRLDKEKLHKIDER